MATQIPLPVGIVGDEDIPKLNESLVNLFNPGDNTLLKTPGRSSLATGSGICRGAIDFGEEHYQVSGTDLIKVAEDNTVTVIGTIAGTADCAIDISFIAMMIVVKGGNGYVYSTSTGLVQITDPDYKPSIDVTSINQRFVFVPEDGGPIFYTDVNNPEDIPSLNFFDAEFLPDKNKGAINLRNDLYIGGGNSFEVFRDQGDTDLPFIRVDGAAIETGYIAAKAIYKDTFLFLGKDRGGSYAFHGMGSGDAPKISNPAIDELINNEYTLSELEACTSQRFTSKGIDMVCFRLARHSLLYYGSGWSYIQTGIDGLGTVQPWDVKFLAFSYGKYITGSATSTEITTLTTDNTELGLDIERVITTYIKSSRNAYFVINNLFLDCIVGTSLVAGTVGLEVSKDSLAFGPQVFRSLASIGNYQQQLVWYGGIGVFESFAGIRIRTTADVNFSMDGLMING